MMRHVPKVETQVVDRQVIKVEIQTVEKVVEVPQIQIVDKIVEVLAARHGYESSRSTFSRCQGVRGSVRGVLARVVMLLEFDVIDYLERIL